MKQPLKLFHLKNKHKDKTGIIIGGGPSINQLLEQKFPFNKLSTDYVTVGTNMSYTIMDTDYLLFMDRYFWHTFYADINRLDKTIKLTQLEKEYAKLKRPLSPNIIRIQRKGIFYPLIDGEIKCNNTGSAALSFANYLGLKKIYLFGCDMCLDKNDNKNFHKAYKKKAKSVLLTNMNINNHYLNIYKIIKELTEKHQTQIYSCSKSSKLNRIIQYIDPTTLI